MVESVKPLRLPLHTQERSRGFPKATTEGKARSAIQSVWCLVAMVTIVKVLQMCLAGSFCVQSDRRCGSWPWSLVSWPIDIRTVSQVCSRGVHMRTCSCSWTSACGLSARIDGVTELLKILLNCGTKKQNCDQKWSRLPVPNFLGALFRFGDASIYMPYMASTS